MSDPVELRNVTKTYDLGGGIKVDALKSINLTIKQGELVSIMGPSGCGKTTLLNIISGLDNPTDGCVIIDGIDITHMGEGDLAHIRREKIGFVFQFFNLVPLLTALENVQLPMVFTGRLSDTEIKERAIELLRLVGLGHRLHHRPTQMSGGEQQRVAIARALANEPSIIVADEPTGNVDQETGWKIIRLIKGLNETLEQTCIIVTHDPAIAQTSKKILYMIDGKIASEPPRLVTTPSLGIPMEERRQLLLAELGWLKSSIEGLERTRTESSREAYTQAKVLYARRLERLERIVQELQEKRG
ncbi:MAG: ABC transporter ATP-binding protein [Nitrososphaerales archaeon]|nr:ABC transporter ATP-binding protein [Nitrososphaerales archaeon]